MDKILDNLSDIEFDDDDSDSEERTDKFCCDECKLRYKKNKQKERRKQKRNKKKTKNNEIFPSHKELVDSYDNKLQEYLSNNSNLKTEQEFWKLEYSKFKDMDHVTAETQDLFAFFYVGQMMSKIKTKS